MNRIKNSLRVIPALAIVLAMVLGAMPAFASDAEITLTSVMQDDEYVTHYTSQHGGSQNLQPGSAGPPPTASPSPTSRTCFLGLTDNNAVTAAIEPELATDWSYDEETYTWTFTVRDDVPWVQWDPVTDTATELRKVVAATS
jgi:ABC-type transport system substrate-binding protein